MRIKLDENLSRHLKPRLTAFHHDVATVADEELLGEPDVRIAAAARREHRMVLTLDVEFGNLRKYPPGTHPGIILFRPRRYEALGVARFVERFVREADLALFAGCLVVVEPTRVRVRRPQGGPRGAPPG